VAGTASSDPTSTTTALGRYCWRTEYVPDAISTGVYLASSHTNAGSECFTVAATPAPGLPDTGHMPAPGPPAQYAWLVLIGALVLAGWAWGRSGRQS
jgi:hypothetical protein